MIKMTSIYVQLMRLLLCTAVIAGFTFLFLNMAGNQIIEEYYFQSEYHKRKDEKYLEKLQTYITNNGISSKDNRLLNNWVRMQKVVSIRVYSNGKMVFDSDYPNIEMWEEDIESKEYEWLTYYDIQFKDGMAKVGIIGWYEYQLYNYALVVEIIFAFGLYLLLILFGIRNKMRYISKLYEEIRILENGELDYEISIEGKDELTVLAEGLENMRVSFLNMIEKEAEIVQENGRIITEMSHDLRTPVTSILLYTELLINKKYKSEKEFLEYLDKIGRKARRMKQLTDHLFEYSLVSGGKEIELENAEFCHTLFYDLFSETCNYLMQNGFEVEFSVEWPDKKLSVSTEYIIRIIDNITSNIIKYADVNYKVRIFSIHTKRMMGIAFENHICNMKIEKESTDIGLRSIQNMITKMKGSSQIIQEEGKFKIELFLPFVEKI